MTEMEIGTMECNEGNVHNVIQEGKALNML